MTCFDGLYEFELDIEDEDEDEDEDDEDDDDEVDLIEGTQGENLWYKEQGAAVR